MNTHLSPMARIASLICALGLAVVIFVPMWRIDLTAPQYPEGLGLKIYPNKLAGDIDIINGLNHYIGMAKLETDDFIEFTILPYIIAAFSLFGIITALVNRRWFFYVWMMLYILFGVMAMFDFYRWEYHYGHNLDPTAAIVVPGMAYQPPLIGFKQLLNFGAYSFPDVGGYIFITVGLILLMVAFLEWKKIKAMYRPVHAAIAFLFICLLQSCSSAPQSINYGKDVCEFCKMVISDHRFGAELITTKYKVYKFDDTHCATSFLTSVELSGKRIAAVYLADFSQKGKLVKAEESFLLKSADLKSPMGGNIAAFASEDSMNSFKQSFHATVVKWKEINLK
ncbi:MAG: nitrous oxide reductase accessory protein NosL [Chitinophagaceae bacterium]|nr:nitrous oxide reductase accessory protein NosL [Chitinophagaceae bacterium]